MAAPPKITDKQKEWAHAYVGPAKFNASAAARLTGMDLAEGRRQRSRTHVMDYVEELQRKKLDAFRISQERTIAELAAVSFSDITDVVTVTKAGTIVVRDFNDLPRHVTAAIRKVKLTRRRDGEGEWEDVLEIELHDKLKALALLGQHQGLYDGRGDDDDAEKPFAGLEIVAPTKEDAENA